MKTVLRSRSSYLAVHGFFKGENNGNTTAALIFT